MVIDHSTGENGKIHSKKSVDTQEIPHIRHDKKHLVDIIVIIPHQQPQMKILIKVIIAVDPKEMTIDFVNPSWSIDQSSFLISLIT